MRSDSEQVRFPHDAQTVVDTLVDIYRHQSKTDMVAILESAAAEIRFEESDNWHGGQYYYSLNLSIPRHVFAQIESVIEDIQKCIESKLTKAFRYTEPHYLTSAVITPQLAVRGHQPSPSIPSDAINRIWSNGKIRVFLSHVSKYKREVAGLKTNLRVYGISAFVAHEDVEPTREWQHEIEIALNTMHILVAIITPGFANSHWCDQEVGYALGRSIKTIPINAGALPHGFLGKQQAMTNDMSNTFLLAKQIATHILNDANLRPQMQDALITALIESDCWANSKAIVQLLQEYDRFNEKQLQSISRAIRENPQVSKAFGVPAKLEALPGMSSLTKTVNDAPF